MKTRVFFPIAVSCVLAMVLAATQWLPVKVGLPLGSGAFTVVLLSSVACALRLAAERKKSAGAFFVAGLFLLLIALPLSPAVSSLFVPAGDRNSAFVPGEIVFGLLALACIFRAWIIWSSKDESA